MAAMTTQRSQRDDNKGAATRLWRRHQLRNATRREHIKHINETTVSHQRLNCCIYRRHDVTIASPLRVRIYNASDIIKHEVVTTIAWRVATNDGGSLTLSSKHFRAYASWCGVQIVMFIANLATACVTTLRVIMRNGNQFCVTHYFLTLIMSNTGVSFSILGRSVEKKTQSCITYAARQIQLSVI